MPSTFELATDRNGRRFRRALACGLAASVALHAALFALWRGAPEAAAGPATSGAAAARPSPSEYMRAIRLRSVAPSPSPIPKPPAPVTAAAPRAVPVDAAGEGARIAVSLERPTAGGAVGGGGGAPGGGGASHLTPPVPRSVYPEWDPPGSVRGTTVTVRVRVDSTGCPVGPVQLAPPTADEDFNRRLRERVRRMRFAPARLAGRPVEAWAEMTFRF